MSCEDGMKLFNSKIQNSYKNLRAAFHAMDRDSDGLVNRTDLAALLTKLLIPMKREDINDMWDRISDGKCAEIHLYFASLITVNIDLFYSIDLSILFHHLIPRFSKSIKAPTGFLINNCCSTQERRG